MSLTIWILAAALVAVYGAFILALLIGDRRQDARALAGFIPDCLVLAGRLLREPRMSRVHKLTLGMLLAYLAMPIDLVPDFIPVVGQLDDVIVAAWVLRRLVHATGADVVRSQWPGPESSLRLLLRLAEGQARR